MGACAIANGKQDKLQLGNLSTKRDWGWAPEYVQAMEKMLTLKEPKDFIIATGQHEPIRRFCRSSISPRLISIGKNVL